MFVKNQNIVVIFELNTYKLVKNNIINDKNVDICKILMRILFIMHIVQHGFIYN